MRTKTLVCLAALAAGVATSMAQSNVYSLNVVGYINVTIPAGKQTLIANQLNTTNNTLGNLIPSAPPNSQLFKYVTGTGYSVYTFDEFDLVWKPDANATLNPGEGAFFKNADSNPLTLTFVGEVLQGSLTNGIPNGYSIRSSMVPQSAGLDTMGFPAVANDQVFRYNPTSGYAVFTFDEFDLVWKPSVPTPSVGEAFFVSKVGAASWVRNFTVQ